MEQDAAKKEGFTRTEFSSVTPRGVRKYGEDEVLPVDTKNTGKVDAR